jgi:hypothetical protein
VARSPDRATSADRRSPEVPETCGRDAISQVLITVDADMKHTLARQGLALSSVPPAGALVPVKTVINQNFAADNVTVTDRLCPSVVADGAPARAA